jgi:magnesium transporter
MQDDAGLTSPKGARFKALYLSDGVCQSGLDEPAIKAALESKSGVLWVDLPQIGEGEQKLLRRLFGFHQLTIDDCANGRVDTPKVDDYGDYLFIVATSLGYAERFERLELVEVDTFIGPHYVVSVRAQPVPVLDELLERAEENPHMLSRGADFLAHTILDSLVDLLLPVVEEMDETLDALESLILAEPDKQHLSQVLLLKRNTLRLRRTILPLRDVVNRLSRGEFELIHREALIFFRDIYDHIIRVEEMLEGLRDLADSALSSYLSAVNNRMNEVMKALSVVAVIFLPLTLIASIYGTNLDYSVFGLQFEHGFLVMVALMAVVALGLVTYFRYRGWF